MTKNRPSRSEFRAFWIKYEMIYLAIFEAFWKFSHTSRTSQACPNVQHKQYTVVFILLNADFAYFPTQRSVAAVCLTFELKTHHLPIGPLIIHSPQVV